MPVVTCDGKGVVSDAGTVLLAELCGDENFPGPTPGERRQPTSGSAQQLAMQHRQPPVVRIRPATPAASNPGQVVLAGLAGSE